MILKDLNLNISSIGGIQTSHQIKSFDLMFDIGDLNVQDVSINNVFISHTHGDHISGILKYLGLRDLYRNQNDVNFYILEEYKNDLEDCLNLFQKLSYGDWKFKVLPINIGDIIQIKNVSVKVLKNDHRIPSCGFNITREKFILKDEFKNLAPEEYKNLRLNKIQINEKIKENLLSYSGDTTFKFWEFNPEVLESKILLNECTFYELEDNKAFERGHTGINDFIDFKDSFKNEYIVLTHYSGRYSFNYVNNIIKEIFSDERFVIG